MKRLAFVLIVSMIALIFPSLVLAQSTAFTYQGYLELGGVPVSNTCDFIVGLYDSANNQIGLNNFPIDVSVVNGVFTLTLDYGTAAFNGEERYLDIQVQCPGDTGFTTLSPRQLITPNPYSLRAFNANSADIAPWTGLTGVPAGFADGIDNGLNFRNIVLVSAVSGDPVSNGNALREALSSIVFPNVANPYLLYIEPGIYDLGTTPLQLRPFVDVQGSGENVTLIQGTVSGVAQTGVIIGANNVELRDLTVEFTVAGNPPSATGIYMAQTSPVLTNITIRSTILNTEFVNGIVIRGGTPTLEEVTIRVLGGSDTRVTAGVRVTNDGAAVPEVQIARIDVTADMPGTVDEYSVYVAFGTVRVTQSRLISGAAVSTNAGRLYIDNSVVLGTVVDNFDRVTCRDTFRPDLTSFLC